MKLISTDFSDLEKKTYLDFGDKEAIEAINADKDFVKKIGAEIIKEALFTESGYLIKLKWMEALARFLIHKGKDVENSKKLQKAAQKARKEYEDWWENMRRAEPFLCD